MKSRVSGTFMSMPDRWLLLRSRQCVRTSPWKGKGQQSAEKPKPITDVSVEQVFFETIETVGFSRIYEYSSLGDQRRSQDHDSSSGRECLSIMRVN